MIRSDFHLHTTFCDGKNTPEEMVRAALALGMDTLGFSGHSPTAFDLSWCMSPEGAASYRAEILCLQNAYAGQLQILCGVEQDYWSQASTAPYDYVIGSVHYLKLGEDFLAVDETPECLREAADRYFRGDFYALAERYYQTVADVVRQTGADIIGHFDLISKFNEGGALLDETHPRYRRAWKDAMASLLPSGRPLEINTGAITRGYRTAPYPNGEMLAFWQAGGGSVVLGSDAHSCAGLLGSFAHAETLSRTAGFAKAGFTDRRGRAHWQYG